MSHPVETTGGRQDALTTTPGRVAVMAVVMSAYALILHLAYSSLIAPLFSYLGQTYRPPTLAAVAVSLGLVILTALALPQRVDSVPDFVLWVLYLVAVAPSILITQYADILPREAAVTSAGLMAAVFIATCIAARSIVPRFSVCLHISPALLHLAAMGFTILLTGYLLMSGNVSLSLVGLTEVQDVRSSYKSMVAGAPLLGYAIQFQTAVLNPIFMSVGTAHRRPALLAIGVVGQLLIYSVTGYKLTVLSPLFVITLAWALKSRRSIRGQTLAAAITAVMVLAVLVDGLGQMRIFVTVFVNRLIATPGVLTSAYYRVFDNRPKYYWSHSFLSSVNDQVYDSTPGYLVGRLYQHADTQANASFLGDGYANGGWWGVVVEAVVILVVLAFVDAAARGIPLALTAPSSLVAALGLANNSPFSSILTGGFGGLILAFALWPRPKVATTLSRSWPSRLARTPPSRRLVSAP